MDCSPPGSSVHGNSPGKNTWVGCHALFQEIFLPWIESRSLALEADFLPFEPPGKLKNNGVGSLSLLQGIFPTKESNKILLDCRWFLYQLSYLWSPLLLYNVWMWYIYICVYIYIYIYCESITIILLKLSYSIDELTLLSIYSGYICFLLRFLA